MTNPHAHRMDELVAGVRAAAANPEHAWDRKAIDWPMTTESVVVEIGGYVGRWALQIAERYQPHLYVFEPQLWAYEVCRAALGAHATVLNYGLGVRDESLPMGAWETDGCSFLKPIAGDGWGELREVCAAFAALGITHIDLMLMNIEGYEYILLPYMLDRSIFPQRLMVQFHTFADEDGAKLARIHTQLEQLSYTIAWTYGTKLTAWERQEKKEALPRRKPGRKPRAR